MHYFAHLQERMHLFSSRRAILLLVSLDHISVVISHLRSRNLETPTEKNEYVSLDFLSLCDILRSTPVRKAFPVVIQLHAVQIRRRNSTLTPVLSAHLGLDEFSIFFLYFEVSQPISLTYMINMSHQQENLHSRIAVFIQATTTAHRRNQFHMSLSWLIRPHRWFRPVSSTLGRHTALASNFLRFVSHTLS